MLGKVGIQFWTRVFEFSVNMQVEMASCHLNV